MNALLNEWRADGFDETEVALWSVGLGMTGSYAEYFAGDATAPCLVDGTSAGPSTFEAFGANVDDVFVVDPVGDVRIRFSVSDWPLWETDSRRKMDGWVRALLLE